jgi:hypothetical protein
MVLKNRHVYCIPNLLRYPAKMKDAKKLLVMKQGVVFTKDADYQMIPNYEDFPRTPNQAHTAKYNCLVHQPVANQIPHWRNWS